MECEWQITKHESQCFRLQSSVSLFPTIMRAPSAKLSSAFRDSPKSFTIWCIFIARFLLLYICFYTFRRACVAGFPICSFYYVFRLFRPMPFWGYVPISTSCNAVDLLTCSPCMGFGAWHLYETQRFMSILVSGRLINFVEIYYRLSRKLFFFYFAFFGTNLWLCNNLVRILCLNF